MDLKLFSYNLPRKLIAQKPMRPRDRSRLMILDRNKKISKHDYFYNLPNYLTSNDVLVFNDTRVFPARLLMRKPSGGKMEILLLKKDTNNCWQALVGGKKRKPKLELSLNKTTLKCRLEKNLGGYWLVKFNVNDKKLWPLIEKYGQAPLPPYIKQAKNFLTPKQIRSAYQTVYAKNKGSVAAPTAGLHFTPRLLNELRKRGIKILFITLHVGLGTFLPVKSKTIEKHKMHPEYAVLDQKTTDALNNAKQQGRRIIAVGTTTTRILEASFKDGLFKPINKEVNIFIYPPYKFKAIDGLITNFHLPKSTLLMLVSAYVGRQTILKAYQEAIKKKYRFYSFGDAMLII